MFGIQIFVHSMINIIHLEPFSRGIHFERKTKKPTKKKVNNLIINIY